MCTTGSGTLTGGLYHELIYRQLFDNAAVPPRVKAGFIEPMLLLRTDALPDDPARWAYQLKLDGYRAIAFKSGGKLSLRSRNNSDFSARYPGVVRGLSKLPDETVVDGEVIALGEDGRPSFGALQNYSSASTPILYFVFDVMMVRGRDVMREPLDARADLLRRRIAPAFEEPVLHTDALDAGLRDLVHSVKAQGLEGLVAKRRDSRYEPGLRSGAWMKMRINRGQEFVIGGYTIGTRSFDALIFGYYEGDRLVYVARTRNGFTPALRERLFKRFRGLEIGECPFANLPEEKSGRWGQGLTKAKMKDCRWLEPVLVGEFEFLEWTADDHLRHTRFVGLREDKAARDVRRE
jgi:DNA ligase D-like protein (predicted ligase)